MSDKLIKNKSGRVVVVPESLYNQFAKDGLIGKEYFDVESNEVKVKTGPVVQEYTVTMEDVEKQIETVEKEQTKKKLNSKKK